MSADFLIAHKLTMGTEGGFANNPDDAGGPTYKGCARNFWKQLPLWKIIDWHLSQVSAQPVCNWHEGSPYRVWVAALNARLAADTELQEKILSFYRTVFWNGHRIGELTDQGVANWLYDHAVNGGGRGIGWMQTAAGVTADGDIGPRTIAAINAADPAQLLERAAGVAAVYRLEKAHDKPSQVQYLPSWLKRDGLTTQEVRAIMFAAADGEISLAELKELTEMVLSGAA